VIGSAWEPRRQRTQSCALVRLSDARLSPGAGFEPADLAVTCPEGTPACAAGRFDGVGLGTRRRRTQCSASLSYTPNGRGGGIRTRDLSIKDRRNPRLRSRPTRLSRCATTAEASRAARPRFERGPPGSEPGVVPVPPPRIGLDGRARTSNPRLPKPVRSRCATSRCTHGGSRTRTDEALDLVPLTNRRASRSEAEARPAGGWATVLTVGFEPTLAAVWAPCLCQLGYVSVVDRAGVEPATFSLQGSCATSFAPPARGRGSGNRTRRAGGMGPRRSQMPRSDGVTGRTRTGFLRGHVPACRPLQLRPQSTRRDSNPRRPPCEGGGLPLTYPSLLVRRASWSRTTSCRVISAVPFPSGSRPLVDARGLEPPTACVSCRCASVCATRRWSQERSNLLLPGFNRPLHRQSLRTVSRPVCASSEMGPAAGIEPAGARVRAECPTFRTSPAEGGRRESNPRLRRGAPTCCPLTPRPQVGPARPVPGGTIQRCWLRSPCS
jgi:hypothetical protein